jgi:hypothetical protein
MCAQELNLTNKAFGLSNYRVAPCGALNKHTAAHIVNSQGESDVTRAPYHTGA